MNCMLNRSFKYLFSSMVVLGLLVILVPTVFADTPVIDMSNEKGGIRFTSSTDGEGVPMGAVVDSTLTANYFYNFTNGVAVSGATSEGTSLFQWQSCSTKDGTYVDIPSAQSKTYTIQEGDQYLKFKVTPVDADGHQGITYTSDTISVGNVALGKAVLGSSGYSTANVAQAVDGSSLSFYKAHGSVYDAATPSACYIVVKLMNPTIINQVKLYGIDIARLNGYRIEYSNYEGTMDAAAAVNDSNWSPIVTDTSVTTDEVIDFTALSAKYVRYYMDDKADYSAVKEIEIFEAAGEVLPPSVSSGKYSVNDVAETITSVPKGDADIAVFKSNIIPVTGGTYEVYQSDGTTEIAAGNISTGCKVIVHKDGNDKTYTITVGSVPVVSAAQIAGSAAIGSVLNGAYAFADLDGEADASTYQWYWCDTYNGTYTAIPSATGQTYTIQEADKNKYIKFEVTGRSSDIEEIGNAIMSTSFVVAGNLAYNKTATPSSTSGSTGANAVDGNYSVSWGLHSTDLSPTLSIDFGENVLFNKVILRPMNTTTLTNYSILYSMDGTNWTQVYNDTALDNLVETIAFPSVYARHIRFSATRSAGASGLIEMEVFNTFEVSEVKYTNTPKGEDGDEISSFNASEFVKGSIDINNASGTQQTITLIVALYTPDGVMFDLDYDEQILEPEENITLEAGFNLPGMVTGYKIKGLVWRSFSDMKPLLHVKELPAAVQQ